MQELCGLQGIFDLFNCKTPGYSICYAESRNGFDGNHFQVGIRTSYPVRTMTPKLEPGIYYISVKSYRDLGNNKRVYGDWSNMVRVTVR